MEKMGHETKAEEAASGRRSTQITVCRILNYIKVILTEKEKRRGRGRIWGEKRAGGAESGAGLGARAAGARGREDSGV